ncbi:GNAT family N-acetyltransferase [Flavitalea flava]
MSSPYHITTLTNQQPIIDELAGLLIETVANGGSVSFMHPLDPTVARAFWEKSLQAADRGQRIVLGAYENMPAEIAGVSKTAENATLIATVTLLLDFPPNQPHRAEIAKMMTRISHRRRGLARALMVEAERLAIEQGRTLLTLDTATEDGAAGLYESLGFQRVGEIPNFALKPHGGLTGTIIYYKII